MLSPSAERVTTLAVAGDWGDEQAEAWNAVYRPYKWAVLFNDRGVYAILALERDGTSLIIRGRQLVHVFYRQDEMLALLHHDVLEYARAIGADRVVEGPLTDELAPLAIVAITDLDLVTAELYLSPRDQDRFVQMLTLDSNAFSLFGVAARNGPLMGVAVARGASLVALTTTGLPTLSSSAHSPYGEVVRRQVLRLAVAHFERSRTGQEVWLATDASWVKSLGYTLERRSAQKMQTGAYAPSGFVVYKKQVPDLIDVDAMLAQLSLT